MADQISGVDQHYECVVDIPRNGRRKGKQGDDYNSHRQTSSQYYAAKRHTIQIDFGRYCVDLHEEIAAGEERAV